MYKLLQKHVFVQPLSNRAQNPFYLALMKFIHILQFHIKNTQFINGKVPWTSDKENDSKSMQNLIKVLTILSYVVLDAYASTHWFTKHF